MRAYAVLSGLHPTLPGAELRAILEALGHRYRIVEELDLVTVFDCSCSTVRGVAWRAGLVHEAGRLLAAAEAHIQDLTEAAILEPDWGKILTPGDRVRIVFRRLRGYARETLPDNTAKLLAESLSPILKQHGATLTPRSPTKTLVVIATEGIALLGLREDTQPKHLLQATRPKNRPFFHPGSLDPHIARLFVNLARAAPPGPYLDPFCGTAGFPLEAAAIGIPSILCGELAKKLAEGAWMNLKAYNSGHIAETLQWDATRLPLRDETAQSIGTDPPYGRSISLRGKPLQQLLQGFLEEAARVLRPGAYLAYATPHWAEDRATEYTEKAGLKILEKHYQRVHGSLTRVIILSKKHS